MISVLNFILSYTYFIPKQKFVTLMATMLAKRDCKVFLDLHKCKKAWDRRRISYDLHQCFSNGVQQHFELKCVLHI